MSHKKQEHGIDTLSTSKKTLQAQEKAALAVVYVKKLLFSLPLHFYFDEFWEEKPQPQKIWTQVAELL